MACLAGLDIQGDAGKSFMEELIWEHLDAAVGESRAVLALSSHLGVWLQCQPAPTPAPTETMKTWPYLTAEYFNCC